LAACICARNAYIAAMDRTKRALALAGIAALGPISGPLVAGIFRNLRKRQLMLACLYALALPMAWYELALLADWASQRLIH